MEDAPEEDDNKPEKKPKKKEEKTVQAHKLKSNECRMTPDNKVICPFCEAKLGVPWKYSAIQVFMPTVFKED